MRADLQSRIAPPMPVEKTENKFGNKLNQVVDSNDNEDIDFRSLIYNSSENVQKAREGQKKGLGLDANASDQEFFDTLRKQTTQRPTPKSDLDKNDFMKLFVAQLQNQNPLQPKEDADMAAQLAHFNSLEQMVNVNEKLQKMNEGQQLGQAVQLINYIGKEIKVADGRGLIKNGETTGLTLTSNAAFEKLLLEVRDETGQVVSTQEVPSVKAGTQDLRIQAKDKEGKALTDGSYTMALKNVSDSMPTSGVTLETTVEVKGIDIDQGGSFHTEIGKVGQNEIRSVAVPGTNTKKDAPATSSTPGSTPLETDKSKTANNDVLKVDSDSKTVKEADPKAPNAVTEVAKS